jgi:hypothetical protein
MGIGGKLMMNELGNGRVRRWERHAFYILEVTGATRIIVGWVINPPPLEREPY